MNNKARAITNTGIAWTNLGLYGSGQIVGVADTGLDNGDTATINPDFRGRVQGYAWARSNDWSDLNGHGTHVAGTIAGNGVNSGSNPATHSYSQSFAGVAPEAKLVMQSVGGASGALTLPSDLNSLFQQAYTAGARIHSDSWGGGTAGEYDSYAVDVDQFIWNHPDMSIVFAAGNGGTDANRDGVIDNGSISPPATAKNAITVGASESNRPPKSGLGGYTNYTWGSAWPSLFPVAPVSKDYVSDNPGGIAAFSSRGPTKDKRTKPDIVAPGTNIISDRSSEGGKGWGAYNSNYVFDGGTSMATPIVAGAAALVREYYVERTSDTDPSAALIKATLLDGAKDLSPGQYGTGSTQEMGPSPNNVEGWGLLNLKKVLGAGPSKLAFADNKTGLATGGTTSYSVQITNTSVPLRIMLVWSDYPGAASAAKALVNDLDLTISNPKGKIIWGNRVNGGDRTNNVEGVKIGQPIAGTYTLTVKGYNVPKGGQQPFALVANGGISTGQLGTAR
ncbi:MAG: S8 family serine peptidase [Chloroflexi bacterium]|nr:S8 family serine peptidase [Chloroflexota bacterium]